MESTYTGREDIRQDDQDHFAEVTVRTRPSHAPTEVILSSEVLEYLKSVFGADFEYQRHNVWAAVLGQIQTANVKGMMPRVGATSFHVEVVRVRVSGSKGRELYNFLLTAAGMNAILDYLQAWEASQYDRAPIARPN
jgi:hypothetical protein